MSDESIAAQIEQLVAEEHELHDREQTDADRDALAADQDRLEGCRSSSIGAGTCCAIALSWRLTVVAG